MKQLWPAPNPRTRDSIIQALEGQQGILTSRSKASTARGFYRQEFFTVKTTERSGAWQPMALVPMESELILFFVDGTKMTYTYSEVVSISVE